VVDLSSAEQPVQSDDNHHARGLLLTAIGGMALTADIPLIRLADGEAWSILMLRSGITFIAALIIWAIWRWVTPKAPPLLPGRTGAIVAGLYGLASITFIGAVYNTSTANLVFILTFNTMFAAILSWLFLKQRPRPATLLAMAAMFVGVLIIVRDSIGSGHLVGDLIALLSSFLLAAAITVSRHSGRDMGLAALVGVLFPAILAAAMVAKTGYRIDAPWWIVFNGAVVMPISFYCLATGPRYISGPEVAMFYLLETIFAPIWVWMIFSEVPSRASMIGGVILIATLVAHSLWLLHEGRQRKAAGNFRHPA
jgi:drug/metabolite transporter (DMT)-like permease